MTLCIVLLKHDWLIGQLLKCVPIQVFLLKGMVNAYLSLYINDLKISYICDRLQRTLFCLFFRHCMIVIIITLPFLLLLDQGRTGICVIAQPSDSQSIDSCQFIRYTYFVPSLVFHLSVMTTIQVNLYVCIPACSSCVSPSLLHPSIVRDHHRTLILKCIHLADKSAEIQLQLRQLRIQWISWELWILLKDSAVSVWCPHHWTESIRHITLLDTPILLAYLVSVQL